MKQQILFADVKPVYFQFFIVEPAAASEPIKEALSTLKFDMAQFDAASQFRLLFFIDVDSEDAQAGMPYEVGLTARAAAFDINLDQVETTFAAIDNALAKLAPHVQHNLRFGVGKFANHEYDDMSRHSIYTKRMLFKMSGEWILFKNIRRRTGRYGWFYRVFTKD